MPSVHRPVRLPQHFLTKPAHGPTPAFIGNPPPGTRRPRTPPSPAATTSFSLTGSTCCLVLPVPPSINKQYATINGRRVLAAAGRHYKRTVGQVIMAGAASSSAAWHGFLREAQTRALALTVHCYFPTLLRRDLDGGIKITQDALCEAMDLNDNRIMEIHLYKTLDQDHPRIECTLTLTTGLRRSRRHRPDVRPNDSVRVHSDVR